MTPAISVVIPAFDAEAFLAESIASVLAQEQPPAEIVVVDDGSSDGTAAIARSFGEPVVVVSHDANRGEAATRNTGVDHARSELISMHDADDRMLPHRLRTETEALLAAGGTAGCVMGRQRAFSTDDRPVPPWALGTDGQPIVYPGSLILTRRTTYDRVGRYDPAFTSGTDTNWLIRLRNAGLELILIDEVLTERRVHDDNVSHASWAEGGARVPFTRSLRQVIQSRRASES